MTVGGQACIAMSVRVMEPGMGSEKFEMCGREERMAWLRLFMGDAAVDAWERNAAPLSRGWRDDCEDELAQAFVCAWRLNRNGPGGSFPWGRAEAAGKAAALAGGGGAAGLVGANPGSWDLRDVYVYRAMCLERGFGEGDAAAGAERIRTGLSACAGAARAEMERDEICGHIDGRDGDGGRTAG